MSGFNSNIPLYKTSMNKITDFLMLAQKYEKEIHNADEKTQLYLSDANINNELVSEQEILNIINDLCSKVNTEKAHWELNTYSVVYNDLYKLHKDLLDTFYDIEDVPWKIKDDTTDPEYGPYYRYGQKCAAFIDDVYMYILDKHSKYFLDYLNNTKFINTIFSKVTTCYIDIFRYKLIDFFDIFSRMPYREIFSRITNEQLLYGLTNIKKGLDIDENIKNINENKIYLHAFIKKYDSNAYKNASIATYKKSHMDSNINSLIASYLHQPLTTNNTVKYNIKRFDKINEKLRKIEHDKKLYKNAVYPENVELILEKSPESPNNSFRGRSKQVLNAISNRTRSFAQRLRQTIKGNRTDESPENVAGGKKYKKQRKTRKL